MFKAVFKNLNGRWGKLDLEKESKKTKNVNFSKPVECEKWLKSVHKKKKIDFSYGGFLENRENLWKNHYNSKKQIFIHEGMDFNVPVNTEVFLFEEGEFYYQYIKDINYLSKCEEHSKSKKYRILNKLFESGVVAKIGDNDKNPKYFPLPPTFLVERIENEKIVSDLEKIYLKNYFEEFKKNIDDKFLTISFRGYANNWLILFLLKYFMKETSIILMGGIKEYGFYKKRLTDSQFKKIRYFYRSDYNESKFNKELSKATQINYSKISNRRIAIIDDKILIEFLKFPNADHYTRPQDSYYAGYILGNKFKSNDGKNSVSYIYQMIKEVEEIIKI